MKRILTIFSILLIAQGICAQEVQITGKLIKYKAVDNDSITLQIISNPNSPIILKSAISKKGEFSFKYTENSTSYCELYQTIDKKFPMFLSSGDLVSFSADANSIEKGVIVGSVQTDEMLKNFRVIHAYDTEAENLKKVYEFRIDSLMKEQQKFIAASIRKNPYMLSNMSVIQFLPIDTYSDVYQLLDSALQSAYPNNAFAEEFHNQLNKMMVLQEGSTITNIVLADENGKIQSLESLRGKIVLIDFWASWCRPCRMEIPNFKKMYEAYHQYGFDIYSVSVDNDASAWKKALTQEQMSWTNVRDDQKVYSNMFNVSSIPFTILIDKEGKVVTKGLRGQDLSNKILEEIKK